MTIAMAKESWSGRATAPAGATAAIARLRAKRMGSQRGTLPVCQIAIAIRIVPTRRQPRYPISSASPTHEVKLVTR
jgi:hypothetical protein